MNLNQFKKQLSLMGTLTLSVLLSTSCSKKNQLEENQDPAESKPCKMVTVNKSLTVDEHFIAGQSSDLSNILHLGSVIDGKSLGDKTYRPIRPITTTGLNMSIKFDDGSPSLNTFIQPVLSNYRQAYNDLMLTQKAHRNTPITFSVTEIYNKAQLMLAIGTNIEEEFIAEIVAMLQNAKSKNRNIVMLKAFQQDCTAQLDPQIAGSFVTSYPKNDGSDPIYISSINYGKIGLLFFENENSALQLIAAVNAGIKLAKGESTSPLSEEQLALLNSGDRTVRILDGSSSLATKSLFDFQNFMKYFSKDSQLNENARPAIIGFTLRSVKTNEIYPMQINATYEVKECEQ